MRVTPIEPMLAVPGPLDPGRPSMLEPKLDGWRALVYVDDGLCVRTRSGRVITDTVPSLTNLTELVPDGTVLDGELVVGQGRASDFHQLGPSLARRRREVGITFAAFDVVHLAGTPTIGLPWVQRRHLLEALELTGSAWCTIPAFDGTDPDLLLEMCETLGLEGLVAKRTDSTYQPGRRSRSWVKLKTADWRRPHSGRRHERARPGPGAGP